MIEGLENPESNDSCRSEGVSGCCQGFSWVLPATSSSSITTDALEWTEGGEGESQSSKGGRIRGANAGLGTFEKILRRLSFRSPCDASRLSGDGVLEGVSAKE